MQYIVSTPDEWSMTEAIKNGITSFLFLDFDDVINFFPKPIFKQFETYHPNRKKFIYREGHDRYKVNYDLDVVGYINDAIAHDNVQLVWLTSWKANMASAGMTIGMHGAHCPVTMVYPDGNHVATKTAGMTKIISQVDPTSRKGVRVAWVDDKVCENYLDMAQFAENRKLFAGFDAFMAMAPAENIALLPNMAKQIHDFVIGDIDGIS